MKRLFSRIKVATSLLFKLTIAAWFIGLLGFYSYIIFMGVPQTKYTSGGIVILTGGSERIERGLDLFAEKKGHRLLVSGVNEQVTKEEIIAMYKGRKTYNLKPEYITLGYNASNTKENALETRAWARSEKIRSIRVVTAAYHIPRAMLEMETTMPNVKFIPYNFMPSDSHPGTGKFWTLTFYEYNKWLYTWIRQAYFD